MIVLCDSSALIPLSLVNQLHLLEDMYGEVLISPGVYDEVVRRGEGRAGSQAVDEVEFIRVESVRHTDQVQQYTDRLSRADAEVIALAKERKADLIISRDRGMRRRARQEQLGIITLWRFFIHAKEAGMLSAVKPSLDKLRSEGVLIREGVYRETLRQAGEA